MRDAIYLALGLFITLWALAIFEPAIAHDHSRPELASWFTSLQSKGGSRHVATAQKRCVLMMSIWDSNHGHYRVRLQGEWVDVPDSAVVGGPNRCGPTMVWPYYVNGAMRQVRCFAFLACQARVPDHADVELIPVTVYSLIVDSY